MEEEKLWIMETCILTGSTFNALKCLNDRIVLYKHAAFHKMLTDGLESYGPLVDYRDVYISCLDSRSDGTHSLQMLNA